jgi:hypothetical protein
MPKIAKSTLFPRVLHAVFGEGIVIGHRVSESASDVCDCLFMEATAPRTILTSALLLFADTRTASRQERKAIKRLLLSRTVAKAKANESEPDDFQITDASSDLEPEDLEPSRTELDPTELAS